MYSLGEYYIVIPKILKVWPSYIAGKRSFVAFPIYQMSGPTLFLVARVYLIFYQYISRIYLKCTCCVRWGGVTPPHTPPVATSLPPTSYPGSFIVTTREDCTKLAVIYLNLDEIVFHSFQFTSEACKYKSSWI